MCKVEGGREKAEEVEEGRNSSGGRGALGRYDWWRIKLSYKNGHYSLSM